jgi:hypothetical protein
MTEQWAATSVSFDQLADAARPCRRGDRNLKGEDATIVVMQRLHVDDLVGVPLQEGGWHHLNIPAIAEAPERIPLGEGQFKQRRPGDLLDPRREPAHVLAALKASMGTLEFSAQYLQQPIPAEGNLIRREWLKYYQSAPSQQPAR